MVSFIEEIKKSQRINRPYFNWRQKASIEADGDFR